MNTAAPLTITTVETRIAGHVAFYAECSACNWYDCRTDAATVNRNADAHADAHADATAPVHVAGCPLAGQARDDRATCIGCVTA